MRLSLDLPLQQAVDRIFGDQPGALALVNAREGRILALVSRPGFNSNELEAVWPDLIADERAPLLNRATQGRYQPGAALAPFFLAAAGPGPGDLPPLPAELGYRLDGLALECATPLEQPDWGSAIAAGCPAAQLALAERLGPEATLALFDALGLYAAPQLRLPAAGSRPPAALEQPTAAMLGQAELLVSPLQMALAAAGLSAAGLRPPAYFVTAIQTATGGWQTIPPLGDAAQAWQPPAAQAAANLLTVPPLDYWQSVAITPAGGQPEADPQRITWYLAGTAPDWEGAPLALALVLETGDLPRAVAIGQTVMQAALGQ